MATENTHFGAEAIASIMNNVNSVYFIGIGGINMSSLAHITHLRGYRTGGSDRCRTALTDKLEAAGIEINYGHNAKNVHTYGAVVYTVAISPDNEEYLEAKKLGIPCISRADYLGYVMVGYKNRIGISGMHGKSTCTSMCAETFINAMAEPTVLSGAELSTMGGAYRVGGNEHFIFEACEYMDSFLDFNPTIAVILNIEMDHVDYFHSIEQIRDSFSRFASITGENGYAVANGDDENVKTALADYKGNLVSFGIENTDCELLAKNITQKRGCYCFDVFCEGEFFCHIELNVSGYHNIYNALATITASKICGLSPKEIEKGLTAFCGASRRMEYKGILGGARVFDDYGHHPTEIYTTLLGAKDLCDEGGRLLCAFQSHTYTRTKEFLDDFVSALSVADRVYSVDIYSARETDTLGVSAELIASMIGNEKALYTPSFEDAAVAISREAREGDVVVVMGAGDIYKVFNYLEGNLKK
ncbi:MAG: UDP-N-acetylmuramate--L-alanine ligase [Clostridia bacterium]|nr:UDP-N-acetylmuramate--L-alanine ligase [Clostridia bacterium]